MIIKPFSHFEFPLPYYINLMKLNLIPCGSNKLKVCRTSKRNTHHSWWYAPYNMLLSNHYICKYALNHTKFLDRAFVARQRAELARAVIKV